MTPSQRDRRLTHITALYTFYQREYRLGDRTNSGHAAHALRLAKQLASTITPRKDSDHAPR